MTQQPYHAVGILIGIDFYHAFMTGKIIRSKDGPIACGTRLGWVISGRLGSGSPDLHCFETYLLRTAVEEVDLTDILRNDRLVSKGILDDYDKIFKDYEQNGTIEQVPVNEVAGEVGQVHYLPHRPVIREDKETTKIRAVFDASCKVNGPSLNECLYSGPNLLARIFDILIRFRLKYRIGILADIKQAFMNIAKSSEHRNYLRFFMV